jgi:hypothetical protein
VLVLPAVVGRQQVVQRGEQVVVGAGTGLEDRDARGGVRHEHVQQPVVLALHERGAVPGQVVHHLARAGVDLQQLGPHGRQPVRPESYRGGMAPEVSREQVIAHRWRAHQLDRDPGAASGLDDVAMLDVGVQDTGPVAAVGRWSTAGWRRTTGPRRCSPGPSGPLRTSTVVRMPRRWLSRPPR